MKLPRVFRTSLLLLSMAAIAMTFTFSSSMVDQRRVLVFSKTDGYRHESIIAGKAAFQKMATERGFVVDFTEDATWFTANTLKKYNAVVWLNTTGDVLNN